MDYNAVIQYIEDEKIDVQKDCFYHAFQYDHQEFINMLNQGIKSRILLGKRGIGNNGSFYVSLTKNEECESSIYGQLSHLPMFIIDNNLRTIKAKNFKKQSSYSPWFLNSPFPLRETEYDNEYQKFLIVRAKYILGIQYNIYSNFKNYNSSNNDYIKNQLLILRKIIEDLNAQKLDLSIIDSSTSSKINKEKVLSLQI